MFNVHPIQTAKRFMKELLEAPEANSRFVFLLHGVASAVGVLVISVAFVIVKDRTGYPAMVTAIGGGAAGAAIGRFFTKKGDGFQGDNNAAPPSA